MLSTIEIDFKTDGRDIYTLPIVLLDNSYLVTLY